MAVLSFVSDRSSGYNISEFNGTFLPFGQSHARIRNVFIGKDAPLLIRIIYLYLCDQKIYCDWRWGIGELTPEIDTLAKMIKTYLESGTYTPLGLGELKKILPSIEGLEKEDRIEMCSWYHNVSDIKYMHFIYPESRDLLLQCNLPSKILEDLCKEEQYCYDIVAHDILYITHAPQYTWKSLVETQEKDSDKIKGAILTGQLDLIDYIEPTSENIAIVNVFLPHLKGYRKEKLIRWMNPNRIEPIKCNTHIDFLMI